ncbi:hypothetical protein [Sedimentibacter sp.]|uniref:hypothetical protein n=1 Tax=Sedimentibacter sp. TaxID=1960295 RepID=UPI0028A0990F|nr:hypothetical protein [Sedimentibacter sp.]
MRHRYVSFAVGIVLVIVAAAFLLTGAAAIPGSNAAIETIVISDGNTAPVAENIEPKFHVHFLLA